MRGADVKSKELREEKEVPGGSTIGNGGAEAGLSHDLECRKETIPGSGRNNSGEAKMQRSWGVSSKC